MDGNPHALAKKRMPDGFLKPSDIACKSEADLRFGKLEMEITAFWIVQLCLHKFENEWRSFTDRELHIFIWTRLPSERWDRVRCGLGFLMFDGWIVEEPDGRITVTHRFAQQCLKGR